MRHVQQQTGQQPGKSTTLVVVAAFERTEDGDLRPAFEAQQAPSEHSAIQRAKLMSRSYAGVIVWKRPADSDRGDFGEPGVLFQAGDVPEME